MGSRRKDRKEPGLTDESGHDGSSPTLDFAPPTLGSAPTASTAEKVATTPGKPPPAPAKSRLPSVPLRVFAAASGVKPDQFKAFASYARREEMRPCQMPEWQKRFDAFLNRPVR